MKFLDYIKTLEADPKALQSCESIQRFLPTYRSIAREKFFDCVAAFQERDQYIRDYSFAVPCEEAIAAIATRSSSVVEIGAGTGFWSYLLAAHGVDVIATDIELGGHNEHIQSIRRFHNQWHLADSRAVIDLHSDRDVLCCWPTYDESWAYDAARLIRPGQLLCYVGEGEGGCTGDDAFHALLDDHYHLLEEVSIPQFYGIHDQLMIYQRNPR